MGVALLLTFNTTLVNYLLIKRGIPQESLMYIAFGLFFMISIIFRRKMSQRLREIMLILSCLILMATFLLAPRQETIRLVLPKLYWLNDLLILGSFLVASIGAIIKLNSNLKSQTKTNPLTGLGNTKWMAETINSRLKLNTKQGFIIILDIRNFRVINSIFGRPYGNKIIKAFSEYLLGLSEENRSIKVAHFGGVEFCLWIEDNSREKVLYLMDKLKRELKRKIIDGNSKNTNVIIISAGAVFPGDGSNFNELFASVNTAMDRTIQSNEMTHTFYHREMEKELRIKNTYSSAVLNAMENRDFHVCYQLKYDLDGAEVHGLEALARCDTDELGKLSPSVFIPIIHQLSLTIPFTKMIIEMVFEDMTEITKRFGPEAKVSINIPPSFFHSYNIIDYINRQIERTQTDPHRVVFEITEDIFMDDFEEGRKMLESIQSMGIGISLDDFGTGYSSLSYIHNFAVQELKIDKSFIDHIEDNEKCFNIVKAICDIAHANNYMIVAEGVENKKQIDLLKKTSCHLIQGFIFSHPERLEDHSYHSPSI